MADYGPHAHENKDFSVHEQSSLSCLQFQQVFDKQ